MLFCDLHGKFTTEQVDIQQLYVHCTKQSTRVPVSLVFWKNQKSSRFRHADACWLDLLMCDEAVFRASRRPDFEISPDSSINLKICESAAHACNNEMWTRGRSHQLDAEIRWHANWRPTDARGHLGAAPPGVRRADTHPPRGARSLRFACILTRLGS